MYVLYYTHHYHGNCTLATVLNLNLSYLPTEGRVYVCGTSRYSHLCDVVKSTEGPWRKGTDIVLVEEAVRDGRQRGGEVGWDRLGHRRADRTVDQKHTDAHKYAHTHTHTHTHALNNISAFIE